MCVQATHPLQKFRLYILMQPPVTKKPEIISGSNRRTQSNVLFGKPELGDKYYETTTDSTYKPKSAPYTYQRADGNTRSAVPLDYYGEWRAQLSHFMRCSIVRI